MIYKDTHFGRALTELRPPLMVIITTYCLSKQECLDRSENIWWRHLNQMGHIDEYYEVKRKYDQFRQRSLGPSHLEVSLGDLEFVRSYLTEQVEQVYRNLSPETKVFWLKGIRWIYGEKTLDGNLSISEMVSFSHSHPIVARDESMFKQPENSSWFLQNEFTNPAEAVVSEEGRAWLKEHELQDKRVKEVKRFLGSNIRRYWMLGCLMNGGVRVPISD